MFHSVNQYIILGSILKGADTMVLWLLVLFSLQVNSVNPFIHKYSYGPILMNVNMPEAKIKKSCTLTKFQSKVLLNSNSNACSRLKKSLTNFQYQPPQHVEYLYSEETLNLLVLAHRERISATCMHAGSLCPAAQLSYKIYGCSLTTAVGKTNNAENRPGEDQFRIF